MKDFLSRIYKNSTHHYMEDESDKKGFYSLRPNIPLTSDSLTSSVVPMNTLGAGIVMLFFLISTVVFSITVLAVSYYLIYHLQTFLHQIFLNISSVDFSPIIYDCTLMIINFFYEFL